MFFKHLLKKKCNQFQLSNFFHTHVISSSQHELCPHTSYLWGLHQQNTTGAGPGSQLPVLRIIPQGSLLTTAGKVTLDSADNNVLEVEHMPTNSLRRYELSTLHPWNTTTASCSSAAIHVIISWLCTITPFHILLLPGNKTLPWSLASRLKLLCSINSNNIT